MPWHETRYGALFTMESNQVLFEFILRDIRIVGPKTEVVLDPRFVFVCERRSICVAGAPCGDLPFPVGVQVSGAKLVLRASEDPKCRPNVVTLKLTGVRRGFRDYDMPSRTREQFLANEEFLNSAYPRS